MALINTLRKRMGKIVVAVVAFSMFAFILTDLLNSNSGFFGPETDIGVIGGETVTYEEFNNRVNELSNTFALNNGRTPLSEEMDQIRDQAWQSFIVEKIFDKEYNELGIQVTDAELVDMVQGTNIHPMIRQYFSDPNTGIFDRQNVVNFLQQINSAPPEQRASWLSFESTLAPNRRLTKYENLVVLSRFANKYEARREYFEAATAEVAYLYVPYFTVQDSLISINESDLRDYLRDNSDKYQRPASRNIAFVQFAIRPSAEDSAFVQEEVNELYQRLIETDDDSTFAYVNSDGLTPFGTYNPNNLPPFLQDESVVLEEGFVSEPQLIGGNYTFFKISDIYEGDESYVKASHILFRALDETEEAKSAARAQAQQVLSEIQGGADFAFMASQYGTDGTASRGGDLGWFGENSNFDERFKEAAFGFNRTGLIPRVVESDFGYHIIQITEPETNTVLKVATIEKELFVSDRTQNEIYRQADLFASQVSSSEDFTDKANEMGLQIRAASRIGSNDRNVAGLTNARQIVTWLYNDADLNDVSEVFELEDKYVVAMATGIQEAGTAELSIVRSEVLRQVMNQKKADYIIGKLESLEGPYDEIKNQYGDGARTGAGDITLNANVFPGLGIAPEAVGVAFSLEEGESTLPFSEQNGVVMLTLTSKDQLEELESYEDYRLPVLTSEQLQRRREEPYTLQKIYDALVDAGEIVDNRYKFF